MATVTAQEEFEKARSESSKRVLVMQEKSANVLSTATRSPTLLSGGDLLVSEGEAAGAGRPSRWSRRAAAAASFRPSLVDVEAAQAAQAYPLGADTACRRVVEPKAAGGEYMVPFTFREAAVCFFSFSVMLRCRTSGRPRLRLGG